jgi:hypothetical protein
LIAIAPSRHGFPDSSGFLVSIFEEDILPFLGEQPIHEIKSEDRGQRGVQQSENSTRPGAPVWRQAADDKGFAQQCRSVFRPCASVFDFSLI